MTQEGDEGPWHIECSPEVFPRVANRKDFQAIMRLARHVNALRFGQAALNQSRDDDGPAGRRARPGVFFYGGSVLFEALQLVPELRVHFGQHPQWGRSFGRFGQDGEVRARIAKGTLLHRLRNHVGFHVLGMVPELSLPKLTLPDYVIASGLGRRVGDIYYDLADLIPLHYLLGAPDTYDEFLKRFEAEAATVRDLILDFLNAADILLPHALRELGLTLRLQPQQIERNGEGHA